MCDVIAPLPEQAHDGDGVGDVQEHDAGGDHGVEGRAGAEVEQAEERDDEAADGVGIQGDV